MRQRSLKYAQRWSSAAAQEERSDECDVGCNDWLGVLRTEYPTNDTDLRKTDHYKHDANPERYAREGPFPEEGLNQKDCAQ